MVANWCQVCKSNGKSVDHLLHCPSARELWQLLQLIWCHLGNAQFSICYVGFLEGKLSNLRSGDVGEHLLHASCGAFGMRGIFVPLRERSYPSRILSLFLKMLFK